MPPPPGAQSDSATSRTTPDVGSPATLRSPSLGNLPRGPARSRQEGRDTPSPRKRTKRRACMCMCGGGSSQAQSSHTVAVVVVGAARGWPAEVCTSANSRATLPWAHVQMPAEAQPPPPGHDAPACAGGAGHGWLALARAEGARPRGQAGWRRHLVLAGAPCARTRQGHTIDGKLLSTQPMTHYIYNWGRRTGPKVRVSATIAVAINVVASTPRRPRRAALLGIHTRRVPVPGAV